MRFSAISTPSLLMAISVLLKLASEMLADTTDDDVIKGTPLEPFQLRLQGCAGHLLQTAEGCRQLATQMLVPEATKAGFHADLPQSKDVSPN